MRTPLFFYVSGSSPESKRGSWRTSSGPGASADPHSESLGSGCQYPAYEAHEYGKHYADTQGSRWSVTFNFGAEPLERLAALLQDQAHAYELINLAKDLHRDSGNIVECARLLEANADPDLQDPCG